MNYPNIIKEFQEFQANLINLIYPIGSIYMSVNNVSPQVFLGGSWEQIQDTFLLSAGSKHSAGSTGGEETHTLSVAETPSHTHTRGTMNITGELFGTRTHSGSVESVEGWCRGALYTNIVTTSGYNTMTMTQISEGNATGDGVCIDASRNWTGETSSVGSSHSHNNMPPYLTVYMWKRIA
jgi:microcystin-dependent protein